MQLACGLVFLFVAAFLAWGMFNYLFEAQAIRNETGFSGAVYEIAGVEKQANNLAIKFAVGTLIFGAIGLAVLLSGRRENARASSATQGASQERRLATIQELLDQGLITDQEYQAKRRQILAEL